MPPIWGQLPDLYLHPVSFLWLYFVYPAAHLTFHLDMTKRHRFNIFNKSSYFSAQISVFLILVNGTTVQPEVKAKSHSSEWLHTQYTHEFRSVKLPEFHLNSSLLFLLCPRPPSGSDSCKTFLPGFPPSVFGPIQPMFHPAASVALKN